MLMKTGNINVKNNYGTYTSSVLIIAGYGIEIYRYHNEDGGKIPS
jgi:hypothetical protein